VNEGKAREKMERGTKAEALLRNEILREAFEYLEKEFVSAWKNSGVGDAENRERLYMLCQNLSALEGYIKSVIEDGKLARAALDELQSRLKYEKRK
jgi:hypothetical protein